MGYCRRHWMTWRIESDFTMGGERFTVELRQQANGNTYIYRGQSNLLDDALAAAVTGHQQNQPDDVYEHTDEIPF